VKAGITVFLAIPWFLGTNVPSTLGLPYTAVT